MSVWGVSDRGVYVLVCVGGGGGGCPVTVSVCTVYHLVPLWDKQLLMVMYDEARPNDNI